MRKTRNRYQQSDITVYIPCYNGDRDIQTAIDGVLRQSIRPHEVLVVDDGSSVPVETLIDGRGPRVITHPENRGLAASRNTAVAYCSTSLIAGIDSDVLVTETWLENLLGAMNSYDVAGVGGFMSEMYNDSVADQWRAVHMSQNWGREMIKNPRFLYGANTMFQVEIMREVGGYDERLRTNFEDESLSKCILEAGHDLLYYPNARCTHLRKDTECSALLNFWQWYHPRGFLRGDFNSIDGITGRIESVNFRIFSTEYQKDLETSQGELLQVDLMIPWVFCMKDLALYRSVSGEQVPDLTVLLPAGRLRDRLEQCCFPDPGSLDAETELFDAYIDRFVSLLNDCDWNKKAALAHLG